MFTYPRYICASMQVSQIIQIEDSNHNSIHLIQDALFFRAWEKSAWLFCEYFNEYKINCRFYKNIQRELLWLGFPRTLIPKFIDNATKLGMKVEKLSETHYCLKIHNQIHKPDFIEWRNRNLLKKHPSEVTTTTSTPKAVLSGFRLSYDFCLDVYRVTGRLNKEFKFSLGERLRTNASNISEQFY
jgi:hypothetical protein